MYRFMSILGLALAIAPFVLGYSADTTALLTSIILGLAVALPAGYRAVTGDEARWELWVVGTAGVLAMVAPFLVGFTSDGAAKWAHAYVGSVVGCVAWVELFIESVMGQVLLETKWM